MYAKIESYVTFSFNYGLFLGTIEGIVLTLSELSNTWHKGIKTVKYYTFPSCLWEFDGNFFFLYIFETLHTWFTRQ